MRVRRLLTCLLLSCLGVLLALVVGEVALRMLPLPQSKLLAVNRSPPAGAWKDSGWSDPPSRAYPAHPLLGDVHAAGIDALVPAAEHPGGEFRFRTNNLGLRRDTDTTIEKAPDVFRVLVLGDSHTDGYVENAESFPTLLETELTDRLAGSGKHVEVLNAGVGGYAPAQELLWYRIYGRALQPDVVVVATYLGNDLSDLLDPDTPSIDLATGLTTPPRPEKAPVPRGALEQFRLVLLACYALQSEPLASFWGQLGPSCGPAEARGYPIETLTQAYRSCHGCYRQSLRQAAYVHRAHRAMSEAVRQAGGILALIDREVRQDGAQLLVALLPSRRQVEPDLAQPEWQPVASLLGLNDSDLEFEKVAARALSDQLAAAGIRTLALQEPLLAATQPQRVTAWPARFSSESASGPLYYNRDWHLSPRGHRIVATALAQSFLEGGLLALDPH